jgi:hypothetical protein
MELIVMKPAVGFILPWAGVAPAPGVNRIAARGILVRARLLGERFDLAASGCDWRDALCADRGDGRDSL